MDKKELKQAKDDFALHTGLFVRAGQTKTVAQAMAYAEGRDGLNRRLGQQSLLAAPLPGGASASPKAA